MGQFARVVPFEEGGIVVATLGVIMAGSDAMVSGVDVVLELQARINASRMMSRNIFFVFMRIP